MNQYLTEIQKKGAEALEMWQAAYSRLENIKLDLKKARQTIDYSSLDELNQRAIVALEMLQGVLNETANSIVMSKRNEITVCCSAILDHSRAIVQNLDSYATPQYEWREMNENPYFQVMSNGNIVTNIDCASWVSTISLHVNALINSLGQIAWAAKMEGVQDLTERSTALAKMNVEAKRLLTEIDTRVNEADQHLTKIEGCRKRSEENQETINLSLNKTNSMVVALEKDRAAINEIVAKTEELSATADALKEKVNGYNSRFAEFDSSLQQRLVLFAKFEADEKDFKQRSKAMEEEIERLTQKADAMIRGATTAGLSKGLDEAREAYDKKRADARNGFVGAIILLVALSVPMISLMVPQLFGLPPREAGAITPYDLIGRIAIMLPGTWLTYFFSKAYAEFFHLEREYAHKATLAKSVEGFKREAVGYTEDITAGVFFEVLASPSSRKSPKPVQNPAIAIMEENLPGVLGSVKKKVEEKIDKVV